MFVQNQVTEKGANHLAVIKNGIENATVISLCVSYVRTSGVNLILNDLEGKKVKLVCSFDMNITQAQGIRQLLEKGADIRIYNKTTGTFHPKVWLFEKNGDRKALVTSANMTHGGLVGNIEAGVLSSDKAVVAEAEAFFSNQWNAENAEPVTEEKLAHLEEVSKEREQIRKQQSPSAENPKDIIEYLFLFVKQWIDIPKGDKEGIGRLWRGWYIVPDHYLIDDNIIKRLASYLPLIGNGIILDRTSHSVKYQKLLDYFMKQEYPDGGTKISSHDLFVRQAKNYLIKFGWAYHPFQVNGNIRRINKQILILTNLGHEVARHKGSISDIKRLYSQYFEDFTCYGVRVVPFTRRVLLELEYLTLREFDYFIIHSHSDEDIALMVRMIRAYRSLTDGQRENLDKQIRARFKKVKEGTAKSVYGNYVKNIQYTMRVIAWCSGFSISSDNVLKLKHE